jgi:hypothetical protein
MTHDNPLIKSAQHHGSGIANEFTGYIDSTASSSNISFLENTGSTHMLIATKYTENAST